MTEFNTLTIPPAFSDVESHLPLHKGGCAQNSVEEIDRIYRVYNTEGIENS